jgi:tripartite-type tricarboxylate transporter receptor subunit TctC
LFNGIAGVSLVHVPYKGGGPALLAVVSGEVPVYFPPLITSLSHIRQGTVRALAMTSAQRFSLLPTVPTLAESGVPGIDFGNSLGLMVPVKTPTETIAAIHRAVVTALNKPDLTKRIRDLGVIPVASQPNEYAAYVKKEITTFAQVFARLAITAN